MTNSSKQEAILIVSTADWDAQLKTNKQYMAKELAMEFKIIYMEATPHRNPKKNLTDFSRIFKRIKNLRNKKINDLNNIQVVSPFLLPLFSQKFSSWINRANRSLLRFQLRDHLDEIGLIWTFTPLLNGLEKIDVPIVYHSVDLIHEIPHNYRDFIIESEKKMTVFSNIHVIASSAGVEAHLRKIGFRSIFLWTNVGKKHSHLVNEVSERENSVIFVGNLVDFKLDLKLINMLLSTFPETKFHFVGPGDYKAMILSNKNSIFHGLLGAKEASALMNKSKVGIIPYSVNAYTQGVLPLKLFEYLQAGLTVVTTELHSVKQIGLDGQLVVISDSHLNFRKNLEMVLKRPFQIKAAADLGRRHSWELRGIEARNLASSLLMEPK